MSPRPDSESGLIGKSLVVVLIFIAILGVAAVDGGAIIVTKLGVSNAAQQASFDGAESYKATGDASGAEQAANATATGQGAKLVRFVVNRSTGAVTVTLTKKAPTFFVQRFSFSRPWGQIKVTDTAVAPP
ncbi:MAG: hypothetical protein M3O84_02830 [Actinomycetota bacterium]|nr:hypothetical protein [Actinomycetota bacterium]